MDDWEGVDHLMKSARIAYGLVLHKLRVKPELILSDKEQELCDSFGFLEKLIIGCAKETTGRLPELIANGAHAPVELSTDKDEDGPHSSTHHHMPQMTKAKTRSHQSFCSLSKM